jgi:hypothetical protein
MNENQVKDILTKVKAGETVKFNDLRSVASAIGIKTKAGVKKEDLISSIVQKTTRGPGRPKSTECPIVGYKVKIGLRYPTEDGTLTTNMKEGATFDTVEAGQKVVDQLVSAGAVRVWGGTVRAKFLPRYGKTL